MTTLEMKERRITMNKSIYEEALDILMDSLQDPQDEDGDCYMLDFEQLNNISKTLKQAQKQIKELENEIKETNCKKKYKITLIGCDDDTIIYKYLTEYEYHLIQSIALDTQFTSTYPCMPIMEIKELLK